MIFLERPLAIFFSLLAALVIEIRIWQTTRTKSNRHYRAGSLQQRAKNNIDC